MQSKMLSFRILGRIAKTVTIPLIHLFRIIIKNSLRNHFIMIELFQMGIKDHLVRLRAGTSKGCSSLQHISVSTHELGLPGDGQSERDLDKSGFESITGRHRMGMQTLLIFATNSMIIITTMTFLCFLWFAHKTKGTSEISLCLDTQL